MMKGNFEDKLKGKYEYFGVTADIGFYSYGKSLEKGFENAGMALFDVISEIDLVDENISKKISIESEDIISLLYDYLEELLFLHETEFLLFSKFKVIFIKNNGNFYKLDVIAYGEEINWDKHVKKSEVKAITFHQMNVEKKENIYILKVILDL
ncbi:archease [Methanobrevibacter curvatus]|uniref:Protein archease n=1 Tax=Methanobrevibacter curvatus TaxID=49547 RepID=A0A165ZNM4_9EURY|nr:archease [Methanobrevibacter curvatus]KZX10953.1 protein archease [Methanobrevibacter curvatus]